MPENQLLNTTTLTFDQMMALFKETRAQMQETSAQMLENREQMKETDRRIKETEQLIKETDQQLKNYIREADKDRKKLSEQMGHLSNSFGEVVEHLLAPGLVEKFNKLGYHFTSASSRGTTFTYEGKIIAEVDMLLQNTKTILLVEAKAKPREEHIASFIERIQKVRKFYDLIGENSNKKIIGAIAGAMFYDNIQTLAIKAGLFTIVQSGDTVKIVVPKKFKPREF
ncbi:MAG: hypothetical protein LBQ50_09735 [Planctomycetaceae bacterium]|jgi:hypothetical protein|nr:hypothetical protein [Planctomycetaceae bacterium]